MASHFNIFALERRQDPDEPTTTSVTTDTSGAGSSVVVVRVLRLLSVPSMRWLTPSLCSATAYFEF